MKIAMVTHYMPPHMGGVEKIAEALFEGYLAAGHEVRWIASRVPVTAPAREGNLIRIGCVNWFERAFDVPVPLWGIEGAIMMRRLAGWADVLHAQDLLYPGTIWGAFWGSGILAPRCPLVISQHSPRIHYPSVFLRWLEYAAHGTLARFTASRACALVAGTIGGKKLLEEIVGVSPARTKIIPNGIDLDFFSPIGESRKVELRSRLGIPSGRPVVLFVGRLTPRKGAATVYEISRLLPMFDFVQIGDGPLTSSIPEKASNFRRLGFVGRDLLRDWYRAADIMLLPSCGEGLPLVVQEAFATGLPAVVNRREPFGEELIAEGLCLGVSASNVDEAASSLRTALADRESLKEMSARALTHARARFSLDRMVGDYLELLGSLRR